MSIQEVSYSLISYNNSCHWGVAALHTEEAYVNILDYLVMA
jgi:hypothetical protein